MKGGSDYLLSKYQRFLATLGENLKLARVRRRLSAEQIAERAGISGSTLHLIESGAPGSSLRKLSKPWTLRLGALSCKNAIVMSNLQGDCSPHPVVGASWEGFVIENLLACAPVRTEAYFYRTSAGAEVDLVLKFRNGETWAVEIKRRLSPVLRPGFFSAVEDVAADKAFVVYGGEETYLLKPGIEAIGLKQLQEALLAREQGE